ncbi:hypothetical protein MHC_05050 [Mycoplasma haemocanis str. Illinois]|uniref:Uncharacterized protein n=1 Tax=Mycoplasma haemocanis (strain Illinois) TaxID=1111676 RepID=H6N894_MYCHN|nr:hypothetical protein [Mycoplasma haemocanis]AEW45866.1 hypothetical protein MHC_05050 [Mycoplasma haemocanis str. Illinois]
MSLRSKSLLILVGLTSGAGVERLLSSQSELRPEPVITKEEQEGKPARKAKVYAIYHSTILHDPKNGNKPYPEVKGISRTPLTEDVIEEDEELKKCIWRGNSQDRAYAAWDSTSKTWKCSDAMQYKDWFSDSGIGGVKEDEEKILKDMRGVKNLTDDLQKYEKPGKGNWDEMSDKCKENYDSHFSDNLTSDNKQRFCTILLVKRLGYQ